MFITSKRGTNPLMSMAAAIMQWAGFVPSDRHATRPRAPASRKQRAMYTGIRPNISRWSSTKVPHNGTAFVYPKGSHR